MPPTTTSPSSALPTLPPHLKTHTHLLSPHTLNASPHLPALFTLINHCFNISHNPPGHSYLPYSPTTRLKTHTQLSEEIGPNGFTFIMLAHDTSTASQEQKPETVIATASAKPYLPISPTSSPSPSPSSSSNSPDQDTSTVKLFKRQPGPDTDKALTAYAHLPKWEILCMVVEPELQGRGVAGWLMGLMIEEIKRRVRISLDERSQANGEGGGGDDEEEEEEGEGQEGGCGSDDDDDCIGKEGGIENENGKGEKEGRRGKGEVLLMLSSLQELNENYYKKRGWETSGVRRFEKGTMGSRDGFGVVEMMRVVSL